MSAAGDRRPGGRWRRALRAGLPLVVGVPGCLGAGWFELRRALAGREVAWVYAVEWPLYAVVGVYMWWRLWYRPREPARAAGSSLGSSPGDSPGGGPGGGPGHEVPADDPGLRAWQDYVARLQAADPPGGPPG